MRRARLVGLAGLALAALAPTAPLRAQRSCEFLPGTGNVRGVTIGQSRITYLATPNLACADGVRIRSDSAVVFESSGFTQLFGNVRFEDADRRLRAREAQYFNEVGRLQAQQDVELVRKADGSVVRGSDLVYVPGQGERQDRLTVTGNRASATLEARRAPSPAPGPGPVRPDSALPAGEARPDTAAPARVPPAGSPLAPGPRPVAPAADTSVTYEVRAERIVLEGESGFVAVGQGRPVEIVRDSLRAYGDSVAYREADGVLALREGARMEGAGYDLAGETIDVFLPGQDVREVDAAGGASLTGEDLRLTAPRIHLFLAEGAVERLVAMAPAAAPASPGTGDPGAAATAEGGGDAEAAPRAMARSATFELQADSIEVLMPGQRLERLVAVGGALGESTARDSLNAPDTPPVARRDWIQGDTIVATFGRGAAGDSATALERLEARVSARSLYRMEPSDSARAAGAARLAVHYVTGDQIVIQMEAGEVRHMEVTGPARGLHLEPRRSPAPAPDSAAGAVTPPAPLPVDTAAAPVRAGPAQDAGAGAATVGAAPRRPRSKAPRGPHSPDAPGAPDAPPPLLPGGRP